jgi:replicative DNA helicase
VSDDQRAANRPTKPVSQLGPSSPEAEEAVLGSVLIDPELLSSLSSIITASDFYELRHGHIWQAMLALYNRGDQVDNLTVVDELRKHGWLEEGIGGGAAYITQLITNTPTHIYAETYARMVERASLRRRLLGAAAEIAQIARDEVADVDVVTNSAETALFRVTDQRSNKTVMPLSEVVWEYQKRIEYLYNNPTEQLGVPTGFRDLDQLLGGLQRSDLLIVAARPGVGKTSFLLSIALNAARAGNGRVAIFSLEMGREQLVQRFYAAETGINSQRLRLGNLARDEWERFYEATDRLDRLKIFVDDTPSISIQQLRSHCRRLHREHGLDLIMVDYLQLMSAGINTGRETNRVQEVSAISGGLKQLARELNVPVLTAAQLSRSVEQRADKRPMLSDLRESGSIEQDADVVMFLYRDELYNPNTDKANQAEVIIAKHRNGPTSTIELYFLKELTQFRDLARGRVDLSQM